MPKLGAFPIRKGLRQGGKEAGMADQLKAENKQTKKGTL